jgi:four helix bundle protein
MHSFGFQRLHVYARAIAFVTKAIPLVERLPKGYSSLADQLRRSATSIPLNIAEATGRYGRDGVQLFAIARGSALECAAMLDVVTAIIGEIEIVPEVAAAREDLVHVVNILTALIRKRGGEGGGGGGGEGGGGGGGGVEVEGGGGG